MMCSVQANFFKSDADTAIKEDDTTFQARVDRAPRPSDRSAPVCYIHTSIQS